MADILIETEHAVWTLMVRRDDWLEVPEAGSDSVARLIDAGSWFAGARDYHFGLIVFDPERMPVARALVQRYGRSENSLSLRSGEIRREGERARRWADVLGRSGDHPARLRRVASAVRHRTSNSQRTRSLGSQRSALPRRQSARSSVDASRSVRSGCGHTCTTHRRPAHVRVRQLFP